MSSKITIEKHTLTLTGHENSINVLRFSQDGKRLLSGDEGGYIRVWDLRTGVHIQTIDAANFGPVTSIAWIQLPLASNQHDPAAFAAGSGNGNITVWSRGTQSSRFDFVKTIEAHDGPVEDLAFDCVHSRLASAGAGHPQVWSLAASALLQRVSPRPTSINPYICSSVHFCDQGQSLFVTYTETHSILKYNVDPWVFQSSNVVQTRIGSTFLEGDALFVGNLKNGIDLYSVRSLQRIRHYDYSPKVNVKLQLCLARQALDWVVMGGDDSRVRVFDRETGELLYTLVHGSRGLVQTVDAISTHELEAIAAAASELDKKSDIKIWFSKSSVPSLTRTWLETPLSMMLTRCLQIATVIFVVVLFLSILCALVYYFIFLPIFPHVKLWMRNAPPELTYPTSSIIERGVSTKAVSTKTKASSGSVASVIFL